MVSQCNAKSSIISANVRIKETHCLTAIVLREVAVNHGLHWAKTFLISWFGKLIKWRTLFLK